MRINLLQLVFGALMLLSVVFATDQHTDDVNAVQHGSFQGVLNGSKEKAHDALYMSTNRLAGGILLKGVGAPEVTEGNENRVASLPTIFKRKDNETGHSESASTTASLSPTESMTVDTM